jgi:hypothetical protein
MGVGVGGRGERGGNRDFQMGRKSFPGCVCVCVEGAKESCRKTPRGQIRKAFLTAGGAELVLGKVLDTWVGKGTEIGSRRHWADGGLTRNVDACFWDSVHCALVTCELSLSFPGQRNSKGLVVTG